MTRYLIMLAFICITSITANAQTGPGGVGNSSSNQLWLKADDITGLSPNDPLSGTWVDASGNGNNALQLTAGYRPTYQLSGGIASVRFDGVNDYLDGVYTYSARTVFVVYNVNSSLMLTTDLGQVWGNYGDGAHIALDARSSNLNGFSFDGNGASRSTAKYALDGNTYSALLANTNIAPYTYNQMQLISTEFNSTKTMNRQVIGSLYPAFAVGDHQYGGDISEIIVYSTTLNTAQRTIVDNYLAAKYSITLAANDFFAYQATHQNDLAGVGRVDVSNTHTTATSAELLNIASGAGLDTDGEFLLFAHNGDDGATWSATETPNSNYERIAREWRFDETGELGTVTFTIDTTTLTARSAGFTQFKLLVDADGNFSSGASMHTLNYVSGTTFDVDINIADGEYVTIAAFKPMVQFVLTTSAGAEDVGTDSMIIEINEAMDVDVTVDYAVTSGTATGSGTDYTLTAGTATILAGDTTATITFTVNNDTDLEATEDFVVTLSNPNNATIGTNNTHTYSINDNDAARNVGFTVTSGSGSEGTTSILAGLTLDLVDYSNDITIDYSVTGGTATGSGTDYTLASGTATITSSQTTTNISITINDDVIDESNETIIVTLSNPTNANLTANNTFTYTILDNDAAPNVSFSQSTSSGDESASTVNLAVALSGASGYNITVNFSLSGTATFGSDYTASGSSIIIPAGNTTGNIVLTVTDDVSEEGNETIIATITSVNNGTRISPYVHTYTINASDAFGTGGPAGVGSQTSNPLWLKADNITGVSDGAALSTSWTDASGNGNDASQSNATYRPIYNENRVNGKPALTFDGVNDYLDDNRTYSARTVFIVFNASNATQNVTHLAQLWGNYAEGVQVAIDPRTGGNIAGYRFDGNSTTTAKYAINNNTFGTAVANGNAAPWSYNAWNILTVEFTSTQSLTRQVIGSLVPQFAAGVHQFGGDIAEIIVYSDTLGSTRRSIVQNYLAGKYNITIGNDLYSYESTHGNEIIGIGSVDGTQNHFTSLSTEIIGIGGASNLGSGEYLFVGNDEGDLSSFDAITQPNIPGLSRIARAWRFDETGNVGTITVTVDTTYLPAKPAGENNYLLLVYNNSDFTNGVSIYNMTLNNGLYEATGVDVSDGIFMTVATAKNVSTGTGDFNTGSNWASGSVPTAGEAAIITSGKTLTVSATSTIGSLIISTNGVVNLGSYNLTVNSGDFFNSGYLNAGTSTVLFTAAVNQKIKTNGNTLYRATFNGNGGATLQDNLQVFNILTLTQGIITTAAYRVNVSSTASSAISGGNSSSFVNGNLRRGFASNTNTYLFPVGNGTSPTNYYYASIANILLTGVSYIDASFNPLANHDDNDLMVDENGFIVLNMNTAGVWHIEPDAQPSSGSYNFTGYLTNFSGLVDNDYIIVKRPSASVSGADWSGGGGSFNAASGYGRMVSDGVGLLMGLTSFSEFGAGEGSVGGTGLPIELLYFNASLNDDKTVALNWATEQEINNEYFTVEHSADGTLFEEVIEVAGAGNSVKALYYSATDNNPLEGVSYYRLKQTDFDGIFKYCDMVTVNNTAETQIDVTIYPNPVTGNEFTIDLGQQSFSVNDEVLGTVRVVNMLGELVMLQNINPSGKSNVRLPDNLAKGMYILQLDVNNSVTTKLIVTK
jgi:hypothetical protein